VVAFEFQDDLLIGHQQGGHGQELTFELTGHPGQLEGFGRCEFRRPVRSPDQDREGRPLLIQLQAPAL
jgi:hypothetical protein